MQQTARGHNHARLAKAALRYLFCEPGALTGMGHVPRQAFDRDEAATFSLMRRDLTRSNRFAIFKNGARIIVPRTRSCRSRCWEKSQAGLANRRLTQTPYKLELSPIRPPLQVRAGLAFFA